MMRILVKDGEAIVADHSFVQEEEIAIGSATGCPIHLPNPEIAARQALITPSEAGIWFIENLDPTRELLVNQTVVTERLALQHDDEVVLQNYRLEIQLASAETDRSFLAEPELTAAELTKIKKFPLPPGSLVRLPSDPINLDRSQLYAVTKATLQLNRARDIPELVDASLDAVLKLLDGRCAWIGIRRQPRGELDVQGGKLASGQSVGKNPVIELLLYRCVERRQNLCVRRVRGQELISSALAAPLITRRGSFGMVYVDRGPQHHRFHSTDLDVLSSVAMHIATKLQALQKQQAQRSAELSAAEIGVVHAIQAFLDPRTSPTFDQLQVAGYSRSGQENPGDVYDVMQHPDTKITAFVLGHVNGTGALLALSMARLHSTFRVGFLHNDPPHALARALNWLMYDEKDPSTVDALFLLVDPPSGKFKYTRAGKIGAFIVDPNGQPRALESPNAPSIGQVRNFQYPSHMGQLSPGESLALYTRGTATCTNAEGERFGEHRFIELVCDGFGQPPVTTIQDLTTELTTFFEDGNQPDDITIVLLHYSGR